MNKIAYAGCPGNKLARGRERLKSSQMILDLVRSGLTIAEAGRRAGKSYRAATAVVRRAREKGELPPIGTNPIINRKTYNIVRHREIPSGQILSELRGLSPEVAAGVIKAAEKGGYATMAEYFVDLAVEAYYAEGGKDE